MKNPLTRDQLLIFDSTYSTQDKIIELLQKDYETAPGILFTYHQTKGRGRFDRPWIDQPNNNLAMSMAFKEYANHPKPWLIGMAVGLAVASILECQIQWPNDLVYQNKKLGGILTEMVLCEKNIKVPVIGLGINLNTQSFPKEIAERAVSLAMYRPGIYDPLSLTQKIIAQFELMPEPESWSAIEQLWQLYDSTPGKSYHSSSGEVLTAISVGEEGTLIAKNEETVKIIFVADAIFGENKS